MVFSRPTGAKREHDAPRLHAGAAAVARVVGEQAHARVGVIHGLRDEVAAALDALGEQARGFAALGGMALGDGDAPDREARGMRSREPDRFR